MVPPDKSRLLKLGTSAFTAKGWHGSFYPPGVAQKDCLAYYATQFDTVEVDSTFYGVPAITTVRNWHDRTPENFTFALKAPREITHERVLLGTDQILQEFLHVTENLQQKRGPILLQFPYFSPAAFPDLQAFLERLEPFLQKLPNEPRFALEIRNRQWLRREMYDVLRKHRVALTLIDQSWMPRPREWFAHGDAITTNFTYIRWLGDRKGIEERTTVWNETIVDRTTELLEWVEACRVFLKRSVVISAFANNHYAGHGPGTVRLFRELFEKNVI